MGMSMLLTRESLKQYLTDDAALSRPTSWEVSLHTGDPGIYGLDNEVSDAAYVRQPVSFDVLDTPLGVPYAENSNELVFPTAGSSYTVTHVAVWDDAGNMLVSQMLYVSKPIPSGEQAYIASGEIRIGAI